jgi:hypothetical protein
MWDMQQSVANSEQIKANNKDLTTKLVKPIPHTYYGDVKKPIIVDKCRSWTLPENMEMLHRYFDNKPKVIVLVRPLIEIVASFMALRKSNGWTNLQTDLLKDGSEPIMRSLAGVQWAKQNNNGEFIFVTYEDLVDDTESTLGRIYQHCEWEPFKHRFEDIVSSVEEDDSVYGLIGQHQIRPKIGRRRLDVDLSDELVKQCNWLDQLIEA